MTIYGRHKSEVYYSYICVVLTVSIYLSCLLWQGNKGQTICVQKVSDICRSRKAASLSLSPYPRSN